MDILKRLEWLAAFESDWARLVALGIVAVAAVVAVSIGALSKVWLADRNAQRHVRLEELKLRYKFEERATRKVRKVEKQDG